MNPKLFTEEHAGGFRVVLTGNGKTQYTWFATRQEMEYYLERLNFAFSIVGAKVQKSLPDWMEL